DFSPRGDVDLLLVNVFEADVGEVAEGSQAAAALGLEFDACGAADEDAARGADELAMAMMEVFLGFKVVLPACADFRAEKLSNVEEHGETPLDGGASSVHHRPGVTFCNTTTRPEPLGSRP